VLSNKSGVEGYLFFHLPPAVVVVLASGGEGGVVDVSTRMHQYSLCLGREGWLRNHRRWV
jgi:hypothetical protein